VRYDELGLKEVDLEKRQNIDMLMIFDKEWKRVSLFLNLLGVSS